MDGLSKPDQIVSRIEEIESDACAITDHGNMACHIKFLQKMKKANKKPILGIEMYVSKTDPSIKEESNRKLAHLCILAKNDSGWKDLVKLVSLSNSKEYFYHKPRLDLEKIGQIAQSGNLIAFSGHIGSNMSNVLFDDNLELSNRWKSEGCRLASWFRDTFGKDNFFLEVQLMDQEMFPRQKVIAECIRWIGKELKIPCVATQDAHYARKEDAQDQRILICTNMKTTLQQASKPEFGLSGFFKSRQYHIPSYQEMSMWNTDEELYNTNMIADMIEDYKGILKSPILPKFDCPDNMSEVQYFRKLCDDGFNKKIKRDQEVYRDRLKYEQKVLEDAGLPSYFLVVSDILNFVRSNGWLPGIARGSAAGCLVSYLLSITSIDPIPYNLLFERFYNAGRNTKDHISMPDIDIDVPKYAREHVINYIRQKYGEERVGQMVTFQTMKGKSALKDVFRAYGGLSFDEMNKITKNIIEEHKISDELQKMKEETGESSIIRWCLENQGSKLDEWCKIDKSGNLEGPLASRFDQAIRLEGVKTAQSRHPAGIIIGPEPLSSMYPMILDSETGNALAGFEMDDLEAAGGLKFDILGITSLDKIMGIQQDLRKGEIHEI